MNLAIIQSKINSATVETNGFLSIKATKNDLDVIKEVKDVDWVKTIEQSISEDKNGVASLTAVVPLS